MMSILRLVALLGVFVFGWFTTFDAGCARMRVVLRMRDLLGVRGGFRMVRAAVCFGGRMMTWMRRMRGMSAPMSATVPTAVTAAMAA